MDALVAVGGFVLIVWLCEGVLFLVAYRLGRGSPEKPRTKLRTSGMS